MRAFQQISEPARHTAHLLMLENALNQQLLVAKGVLFAAVIGYFAFTSL